MTEALSADLRSALEGVVQDARLWVEGDLGSSLGGRFGINADGVIEPESALSLSNAEMAVRRDLVEIVAFLRAEGEDESGSVGRLVREAAFTQVNRLVAVRVAESVGLLPETMGRGLASSGFRDFSELAPTVAETEWGRFAVLVGLCADELAADVPALFDPRNPLLELPVSEPVFADVVEAIARLGDEVWAAPDALGWAYQFFNTGEERKEMRESSAPRNSRELAVRNQFFTPSYVVEFLVQNGLGAHLAAGFPGLVDEFELLVEVPAEKREVDLGSTSVLDPACGSGHFLLGAYDALEAAWRHVGVEPGDAAPAIVSSLWGIDIDPRAAQIAQAAVMFRARRHCRSGVLPVANVICARALPAGPEVDAFVGSLPGHTARVVRAVSEELVSAPVLGPLLKIEQRLDREARDVFGTGVIEGTLSEVAASQDEADVLDALATIADTTTSSPAQRLFAAEAHDAVRFVEAMNRRYTAVLMNPPFGDPVEGTRPYLKKAYPSNSTRTADLFASFVERGCQLAEEHGSVGAITSRSGMFLQSYEKWRRNVFLGRGDVMIADLGNGVMEQAMVEAAAYVLQPASSSSARVVVASVLNRPDRSDALAELVQAARRRMAVSGLYELEAENLRQVPGTRIAYWVGPAVGKVFANLPALDSQHVRVRRGIQTGDDFRFLRLDWEVSGVNSRWRPLAKGGRYSPYLPDTHLVVDWAGDGDELTEFGGSIVPSRDLYFQPGVTWSRRTASGFSPRLLERGVAFSDKGPGIIGGDPPAIAAYLNSRLIAALVETMVAAGETTTSGAGGRSYDTGLVGLLPAPPSVLVSGVQCESLWQALQDLQRVRSWNAEPLREWDATSLLRPHGGGLLDLARALQTAELRASLAVIEAAEEYDTYVTTQIAAAAGVDRDELDAGVAAVVGDRISANPRLENAHGIAELWAKDIEELIDDLIDEHGGSRNIAQKTYRAHRRLEVISHALGVSPSSVVDSIEASATVSPELTRSVALSLISALAAKAFGSVPPTPEQLGVAGIAELASRPPLPQEVGLFVDEDGSPLDLASHIADVADDLGLVHILAESVTEAGWRGSLKQALRRNLFSTHLVRYSMSRRKAPLYWQLQTPSRAWGVWLFAPSLSRETLFGVGREAERRLKLAEQRIAHLRIEAEDASGGRAASEIAKELEAEEKLAVELLTFRSEAERIAGLGWEPDHDDGMVLNAAPLAALFPAWRDAEKYRKELKAGKHEWATVARYADQL